MLFNSFPFILLFMPVVLTVASLLKGQWLLGWIAVVSFAFYAHIGETWFVIPLVVTTCLDFVLAPFLERAVSATERRLLLTISLSGNLGMLVYFKYMGLFIRSSVDLTTWLGLHSSVSGVGELVLPAGLSFYTFQTVAYMIDVYRGDARAERNFLKFFCFVAFFPHLVAGPLTRHNQLLPGLERISRDGISPRWAEGLFLFTVGLCKKVLLADRIAELIDPMIASSGSFTTLDAWLAMGGYALQIYFDFSGYSDMAIGLGRLFGIELPQNFKSPYQALNPSDFWKRWHITLSSWLRDYLYISLGGNRCSRPRQLANLMITMCLGGLWHGAQWTFALWGLFHGTLLLVYHLSSRFWDRQNRSLQRAVTFLAVCVGWIFFRSESFGQACHWLLALLNCHPEGAPVAAGINHLLLESLVLGGLVIVKWAPRASDYTGFAILRWDKQVALGIGTVLALLMLGHSSKFLYFQF